MKLKDVKDEKLKPKRRAEYQNIDSDNEIKKLNRITGQIDGVRKMLEEKRKLKEVLMQCKAIHSALSSVESRVFKGYLEVALDDVVKMDKKKDRTEKVAALEELFQRAS